jgi:membrane-bound lytic murein transglycosylase D
MSYLDRTLQAPHSCLALRAVFCVRTFLVFSCVFLATGVFLPQESRGELPTLTLPDSSETFTFNYSLAHKGDPQPDLSQDTPEFLAQIQQLDPNSHAHPSSLKSHSVETGHDYSLRQSSATPDTSSEGLQKNPAQHYPADSFLDTRAKLPEPETHSSDSGSDSGSNEVFPPSASPFSPGSPPSEDAFCSVETIANLSVQPGPNINSLSKVRFNAAGFSEQRSQVLLARFGKAFDPARELPRQTNPDTYGSIALVLNESVEKNLDYFQHGIPERFQSYLDRFHHYQDLVEPVFRELGLPLELMYLSLVESGFNPRAFSRSRASGPWQFMKGTGRLYGLEVDWFLDERRDPIKSTVAAAHHLRDLYDQFGTWPLALAAYNAGSGKISRAIKKTGTRDFWTIRRSRHIKRETKEYVPRFIAATLIAQNPTAYGFKQPDGEHHAFEEVLITKRVHLSAVTQQTGIPVEELKRLNPELRRSIVPSLSDPGYYLKVPLGMGALVEEHHPKLVVWTQPPPPPTEWYRVRRGDSLSVVAKRFGMKVRQLKEMNNLRSNIIRVGTKLRVRGSMNNDDADRGTSWYRVRSGDSLGKIANRFRVSVRSLMKLNNLSTHIIHPGDRLRIKGTPEESRSNSNRSKWYQVRRGDSLWTIARQFQVSVQDLRALNNLSSSIIQAGHMLMVSQ